MANIEKGKSNNNPENQEVSPVKKILQTEQAEKEDDIVDCEKIADARHRLLKNFDNGIAKSDSPEDLRQQKREELAAIEKMGTINGVNFSRCQIKKIVEAYKSGKMFEFETLSPYLADYNMVTGEIWADNLTDADKVGLTLSWLLKTFFPEAVMVSLYDEYNSNMADSSTILGAPTQYETVANQKYELRGKNDTGRSKNTKNKSEDEKSKEKDKLRPTIVTPNAPQLVFAEQVKEGFKRSLEKLFRDKGSIRKDDVEGKDFLLVSESSKIASAERLVEKLRSAGKIKEGEDWRTGKKKANDQSIYFVNPNAEDADFGEIILRTTNGRWLCEALDASSYIDEKNLEIIHLVVLPIEFKEQQDKVWEMLRSLGISGENYHNIFYDTEFSPEVIAKTIKRQFEHFLQQ